MPNENENETESKPSDYELLRLDLIKKLGVDRNVASTVAAILMVEERLIEIVELLRKADAGGPDPAARPPTPGSPEAGS